LRISRGRWRAASPIRSSSATARALLPAASEAEREAWCRPREAAFARADGTPRSFVTPAAHTIEISDRRTANGDVITTYRDVTDERLAQERVAASEALFRDGIESMGEGFALWDRDGRLVTWNRRYLELLPHITRHARPGVTLREINTAAARDLYPDWTEEQRQALVDRRLASRRQLGVPFELSMPGGEIVEIVDHPTGEGGHVSIFRDVTLARRAADRLTASEARFRDGIESLFDGFMLWDSEDRLAAWNRNAEEMLPYARGLLAVGLPFAQYVRAAVGANHAGWSEQLREQRIRERVEQHRERNRVTEFATSDGRFIELRESRTSAGGCVSLFRDVTMARRGADRLAASEARFRDGIESLGVGFMMWDGEDRLAIWNRRVEAMLPYAREVLTVGMRFEDYIRAAVAANHLDWTDELRERRIRERLEAHRRRQDRVEYWTRDGRLIELHESPTSAGGCVSLYHDITERHSQAEKLERALDSEREMNAQQRRFVAMASHEFRTPLAIIDGAAQRITARAAANVDPDVAKRLFRIRGAVSRMAEMIDRTLSTARLDEGRISFDPVPLDVGALLHEICERQRGISPQFRIELELDGADLEVHGDPRLLDQVFTNLVSNAIKYAGRELRAEVVARVADDAVEIAVRDHGIGVPADEISKLFTRFFRARTAAGIPGTGIGLNLVKEFVELHRGAVRAEANPDGGMTFTIRLPRHARGALALAG
jgi:PAS domain S-box-containing protein